MAFPVQRDIEIPLLQVLIALGGRARPKEVIERVTTFFPQLTPEDLTLMRSSGGSLKWRNMVEWVRNTLCDRGEMDRTVSGVWAITELGRQVVTEVTRGGTASSSSASVSLLLPRSQVQVGGPTQSTLTQAERSTLARTTTQTRRRKQPADTNPERRQQTVTEVAHEETALRLPFGTSLVSSLASSGSVVTVGNPLYHRIRTTAHSGTDATAFEEALAEAFRLLGFDAVKIGGRGDTDVRVTAPLGKHRYVAIVDAKSSRTGKVADTALHFSSLNDHREKHQAKFVMVVGPTFTRGNAIAHAERENVVLMEVESFLATLEMHARTPLSLYTLRDMFVRPGLYGAVPDHIQDAHEHTERLGVLLPLIIQKIEHWYTLHHVDAVNADGLFIAFIEQFGEQFGQVRYQKTYIEEALAYLVSPFVGALQKNDTGYYLTMPFQTVRQRLLGLSQYFQEVPPINVRKTREQRRVEE